MNRIKKIIKELTGWLSESNRDKHLGYGALCTILVLLLSIFILTLQLPIALTSSIFTLMVVGSLATGMEFKDKMWGGEFDWLDLLATILFPILIVLISIIF